jgi:hypothetical protein
VKKSASNRRSKSRARATSAAVPARWWRSGVFDGAGPYGDLAFADWRGAAITTATDFLPANTWSEIEDPAWAIDVWRSAPSVTPGLSVAMWPWSGGSLVEAAAGEYDGHFAKLAENLVDAGLGGVTIRLGWEFNGSWYRWAVKNAAGAAQFAQAWRTIVDAMRSIPGQSFNFDWAPDLAFGGVNPALAYPGNAYVSDIGLDVYDWARSAGETATTRWNGLVDATYGLQWQATFAAAHDKPVAFPEWGLTYTPSSSSKGSFRPSPRSKAGDDDTLFIRNMYDWFSSHETAFEDYFDSDSISVRLDDAITDAFNPFPKATALYRQLFG